ncbi:MAG TPA: sirohydrochlorin chelatase [Candidatus Kapabacteria bacterium]|nr:sirohydrochlorin chelatase [Candidatus Kapabacteria bacterium]
MTDVILLVGHGSREQNGNTEIEEFAHQWRARRPRWLIQFCFIEFADVLLEEGLDRAARSGQRVIVVPLILNAAGHVKMEIPQHIAEARARHPLVRFAYTPHLGASDPILRILKRRLQQGMAALDMPDPCTTGVVVLGRGASDKMANGDVAKMARWLQEDGRHELVDIAFTGITYPRLERVVQRQVLLGMTQIVVLPYYLFTGTLIERIRRQVEHLRLQYPRVRFACGEYFGFEDEIFQLLEQHVESALRGEEQTLMPCDGCKYREVAEQHGYGHSHHRDHGHDHEPRPVRKPAHPHDHDHAHA